MELINKKTAYDKIQQIPTFGPIEWREAVNETKTRCAAAIDRIAVEENRGTGFWIDNGSGRKPMYKCSCCKKGFKDISNYCPKCGAIMQTDVIVGENKYETD